MFFSSTVVCERSPLRSRRTRSRVVPELLRKHFANISRRLVRDVCGTRSSVSGDKSECGSDNSTDNGSEFIITSIPILQLKISQV